MSNEATALLQELLAHHVNAAGAHCTPPPSPSPSPKPGDDDKYGGTVRR